MTRTIIIALFLSHLCSCGSGLKVRKSKVQNLNPFFSATIANCSYKVKPEKDFNKDNQKLLDMLHESTEGIDSVNVYFNSDKELIFEFTYKEQKFTRTFKGRFTKRGYYEFYLDKKIIEIPPILPILYSKVHIERYRLGLTIEGDLIVDELHENSGNIFILGAGYRYRLQNFHKCVNRQ